MEVTVHRNHTFKAEMSHQELSYAIMDIVQDKLGNIDDAGCDWFTKGDRTFIGEGVEWQASDDPQIAVLVNAANIIRSMKEKRG
jgi:hypothetical protein